MSGVRRVGDCSAAGTGLVDGFGAEWGMAGGDELPPIAEDGLRHWFVAGGVLRRDDRILLVENQRRNGTTDWSTPGGVVEPGEDTVDGLTREVVEETGLTVASWRGPLYRVVVFAPDLGFRLHVEAHEALRFDGELAIDDPDGIVIGTEWTDLEAVEARLDRQSPWVTEPLLAHLHDGVDDGRTFGYRVDGRDQARRVVTREYLD